MRRKTKAGLPPYSYYPPNTELQTCKQAGSIPMLDFFQSETQTKRSSQAGDCPAELPPLPGLRGEEGAVGEGRTGEGGGGALLLRARADPDLGPTRGSARFLPGGRCAQAPRACSAVVPSYLLRGSAWFFQARLPPRG